MSRLRILHSRRDFLAATSEGSGFRVLTNVSFDGAEPETIRLNLASPNSSLRRAGIPNPVRFRRGDAPFDLLSPSVLLTADQLRDLQDNFAMVHQAVGDFRLGNVSIGAADHVQILPRLQACALEIVWFDRLLAEQSMDTALYRSNQRHPQSITLMEQNGLSVSGRQMLDQFNDASAVYCVVPELRGYLEQGDIRRGELGPRGEQFREWLQGNGAILSNDGRTLEFVAYALRPLRMTGSTFQWKQDLQNSGEDAGRERDLRRLAVDLLFRFEDQPVWCEFKAAGKTPVGKGDTWTSSALQQVLVYGSMLCSGNQVRRCRRQFKDEFQSFRPWLGVIVEERDELRFQSDFNQAVAFVRQPDVGQSLQDFFGGFILAQVRKTDSDWSVVRFDVTRW